MVFRVLSLFLYTLAIASCIPVLPSYNSAASVAEKASAGNYYNQNVYSRDDSRIRHVSTTIFSNAASTNEFATALSQPVPIVETIANHGLVVEPVHSYYDTPIVDHAIPISDTITPYYGNPIFDPIVESLVPYEPVYHYGSQAEHIIPYYNTPTVEAIVPYYGTPTVESLIPHYAPYSFDSKFPYYETPVVESAIPYYGTSPEQMYPSYDSLYSINLQPFTSYNYPGYYGLDSQYGSYNFPVSQKNKF